MWTSAKLALLAAALALVFVRLRLGLYDAQELGGVFLSTAERAPLAADVREKKARVRFTEAHTHLESLNDEQIAASDLALIRRLYEVSGGEPHVFVMAAQLTNPEIRPCDMSFRLDRLRLAGDLELQLVDNDRNQVKAAAFTREGIKRYLRVGSNSTSQHFYGVNYIERASVSGDSFSNIHNSTIINRSNLKNASVALSKAGRSEAVEALGTIAAHVQESGNDDAAENFDGLTEELEREPVRPARLKSFWNGLVDALPSVAKLGESTAAIIELFGDKA